MTQQKPDFERLSDGITRAKVYWDHGDFDRSRAYLKVIGSIAMSYAEPIDPTAPIPESAEEITIGCRCGWTGVQSALLRSWDESLHCPKCGSDFAAFPKSAAPVQHPWGGAF